MKLSITGPCRQVSALGVPLHEQEDPSLDASPVSTSIRTRPMRRVMPLDPKGFGPPALKPKLAGFVAWDEAFGVGLGHNGFICCLG